MKKLIYFLIIPLFISCYQETNLDFLFNGSIAVNGSDTLLVDSITGVFDADYVLTFVDFDITLGYLPGKTAAKLNGQPICTFFQNANYADTSFVQWLDQELNADSTENKPFRIQRIAHYSTPTPDVNDFFETPIQGNITVKKTGGDYATIDAAIDAASVTDTIDIYDGDYEENDGAGFNLNINKQVVLRGVGNVEVTSTTSAARSVNINASCELRNITFNGVNANQDVIFAQVGTTSEIYNCVIKNSAGGSFTSLYTNGTTANTYLSKCSIIGNGQNYIFRPNTIFNVDECVFTGSLGISMSYVNLNNLSYKYCKFDITNDNYLFDLVNDDGVDLRYCDLILSGLTPGLLQSKVGNSSVDVPNVIKGCNISSEVSTDVVFNLLYGVYNNTITNDSIQLNSLSQANNLISLRDQRNTLIDSNYINISNSTNSYSAIIAASTGTDCGYFHIKNNEILHAANANYSIGVGTETSTAGDNMFNIEIIGNKVLGGRYFDTDNIIITTHGLFVGFQNDAIIKYNYVNGSGINCIVKANSSNSKALIQSNISINARIQNFYSKAFDDALFYNNTSINTLDYDITHFYFSINAAGQGADDNQMINNIIYDTNSTTTLINIDASSNAISNYNIIFDDGVLTNSGIDYNFSAWQGLGYDLNSFNTDPNFKSSTELWPISQSDAIGNATYLIGYDTILNVSSAWPDTVINKQQFANKTIGAYVSPLDTIDYYNADTTTAIWSNRFNQAKWIYNNSVDTIQLSVDNFPTWSIKTNEFIDAVGNDSIIYGTDDFEDWRTKFNNSVDTANAE